MDLMSLFRGSKKNSASVAKERLQLIVAHQRAGRANGPEWLAKLQAELLEVVRKYVHVEEQAIQVESERDDDVEMLRVNITLPDSNKPN